MRPFQAEDSNDGDEVLGWILCGVSWWCVEELGNL